MYHYTADLKPTRKPKPLQLYPGHRISKRYMRARVNRRVLNSLKRVVPNIAGKKNVSEYQVLVEAASYIDHLHSQLASRYQHVSQIVQRLGECDEEGLSQKGERVIKQMNSILAGDHAQTTNNNTSAKFQTPTFLNVQSQQQQRQPLFQQLQQNQQQQLSLPLQYPRNLQQNPQQLLQRPQLQQQTLPMYRSLLEQINSTNLGSHTDTETVSFHPSKPTTRPEIDLIKTKIPYYSSNISTGSEQIICNFNKE